MVAEHKFQHNKNKENGNNFLPGSVETQNNTHIFLGSQKAQNNKYLLLGPVKPQKLRHLKHIVRHHASYYQASLRTRSSGTRSRSSGRQDIPTRKL